LAINCDALFAHDFGQTRQAWEPRDAILYALGVGLARDPLDEKDLAFMDETALSVLPSFGVTLASPGMWMRDEKFGVDFTKLLHMAQAAWFENPLPASGEIIGTARVHSLADRGEGKGAIIVVERNIADSQSGESYCRLHQTLLLRGDGGFGGEAPTREPGFDFSGNPDVQTRFETSPRAALIYRLSGDWNPLHLKPDFAKNAGFDRPILQGLASYGIAGAAVSRALGFDPTAISQLACRFSGAVMPGDPIDFKISKDGASAHFQAFVEDRKVLDGGKISWRTQGD
jgi:acyl dehydratase